MDVCESTGWPTTASNCPAHRTEADRTRRGAVENRHSPVGPLLVVRLQRDMSVLPSNLVPLALSDATSASRSGADRRNAQRIPASDLPWIRGVRVGNLADAEMINVSSTGVLHAVPSAARSRTTDDAPDCWRQQSVQATRARGALRSGRPERRPSVSRGGRLRSRSVSVAGVGAYVDAGGLMQTGLTAPNPVSAARGDPCAPRRGRGARTCASCRRETFTRAASDRCRHR